MIVTLTPNPSLDLLFTADRLVWDDANRVAMPRRRPGGQGINVVRAARALDPGADVRAIAPLGGAIGREMEALLAAEGTPLRAVPGPGETRIFVGVREEAEDRSLLLNPRGPEAGAATAEALMDALVGELEDGEGGSRWLACCGSLLPGLPADFYARAGAVARERGWRFVPDCDGTPLRLAAAEADLLVPNVHEAERLLGRAVRGVEQAGAAARELLGLGAQMAAVTMGASGAVFVGEDGCWWARLDAETGAETGPELRRLLAAGSAVGAGDAFLAALLLALEDGLPAPEPARNAVAAGTATLLSRGAALLEGAAAERLRRAVVVERLPG